MGLERIPIQRVTASAYVIPTDGPEADGTIAWNSTTMVLAEITAGDCLGFGFSYADASAASLIHRVLAKEVTGLDAMATHAAWLAMIRSVRNMGRAGIASTAIAAVDTALWDLKAKLLGVSLFQLLGPCRDRIMLYGSGGFTTYSLEALQNQLGTWAQQGFRAVKMKVGTEPAADAMRVSTARSAIGTGVELFVDANGAYSRKEALTHAAAFAENQVSWFEEPVSSDDLEGLRLLRDRAPARMRIAAGEYSYDVPYVRRMLEAQAVDVQQVDATRCLGITGFMQAGAVCAAHMVPMSAHTAPSIHVHPCCALPAVINLEYFHDHARLEHMLFEGALDPTDGMLTPARDRPGLGLEFKRADAERFAVQGG